MSYIKFYESLFDMPVGFTGNQQGMTPQQISALTQTLKKLGATAFHHGDCIGSDNEAHTVAQGLNIPVILHPPINASKRAWSKGAVEERDEKEYLARNQDIINETKALIGTPRGFKEVQRSGTWSTIRRGKKTGKPVYIIWPDGVVEKQ